ncbi:hypothetical protein BU14_0504s0011 [Porphyra umbilicalis]|uniref:Uncharacterized protein n=1 Tax=Porphyra umbilicalis TaxID=2786 RepID=A0A1X6NT39_PORUM|nr:hypothetical protein BU14_0504s0011 [Porphyra umbilicalis]|eukprot:OSX71758.1 hypothetical protein BU14_0504s0011 [Porphyra umbilicalis]
MSTAMARLLALGRLGDKTDRTHVAHISPSTSPAL